MASIAKRPNGHKWILFIGADQKRRTVRLGKTSMEQARSVKVNVERRLSQRAMAVPYSTEVTDWLNGLDDKLYGRLVRVGLCDPRAATTAAGITLAEHTATYLAKRDDLRETSLKNLRLVARCLSEFFGDTPMSEITVGDAKDWRRHIAQTRADATVSRWVGLARQFFDDALDRELIAKNPFRKVPRGGEINSGTKWFVTRETVQTWVDSCPCPFWRVVIALSRYGGLRCPSEISKLRWCDVLWDKHRICVESPKTGVRFTPIFPELRPYLEAAFEAADDGEVYVAGRRRNASAMYKQLQRLVIKAGLEPWPRLTHNMRSSRQTELADTVPIWKVCKWLGNSTDIARDHYLQMRDEDYAEASGDSGPQSGTKANQKANHPTTSTVPDALTVSK